MLFALSRPRMTAAFVALTLACSAGLASAGSLPGAAQDIASAMLAKVGISVPGPNEHAGTHPSVRGSSSDASSDTVTRSDIAELATTTDLTGIVSGVLGLLIVVTWVVTFLFIVGGCQYMVNAWKFIGL